MINGKEGISMKKTILLLALLALFALVALPHAVQAEANVSTEQIITPIEGLVVVTPPGCEDLVHIAGSVHVVIHTTDLGDGNALVMLHAQPQGAVTQGLETGNIYHGIGVTRSVERTLGPGESYSFVNVFMQVPEVGVQAVVHVTVNANGEISSSITHEIMPGFSTCAG
jgi:hypothetical protein